MSTTNEAAVRAFKEAVLTKMASQGVLPSDMEKRSAGAAAKFLPWLIPAVDRSAAATIQAADKLTRGAVTAMLTAPAVAAAAIGHLHAGPAKVSDEDIKAERDLDLIRAYRNARSEFVRSEQLHREGVGL